MNYVSAKFPIFLLFFFFNFSSFPKLRFLSEIPPRYHTSRAGSRTISTSAAAFLANLFHDKRASCFHPSLALVNRVSFFQPSQFWPHSLWPFYFTQKSFPLVSLLSLLVCCLCYTVTPARNLPFGGRKVFPISRPAKTERERERRQLGQRGTRKRRYCLGNVAGASVKLSLKLYVSRRYVRARRARVIPRLVTTLIFPRLQLHDRLTNPLVFG